MKNIASYALFGNRPEASARQGDAVTGTRIYYWNCLPGLIRSHHHLWPNWELRIHVDSTYETDRSRLLRAYVAEGLATIKYVEENISTCRSMLWRLLPLWEEDVGYVLSRDVDSMPSLKDRRATETFMQTGAALHCMNDNEAHGSYVMGGMVSFYAPTVRRFLADCGIPSWQELINRGPRYGLAEPSGGPDQNLLVHEVWNRFYPNGICSHRFSGLPHDPQLKACFSSVDTTMRPFGVADAVIDNDVDKLNPFLGCSGYPIEETKVFFDTHGFSYITEKIQRAERSVA